MVDGGSKITVYVPCDVASIRVLLGYDDTLTPVERIVLRTVHAGLGTLPEIADVLGLGRRLTMDLVHDLWRAGYLRLIRAHAGVEVSAEVVKRIQNGTLDKLKSAENIDTQREVMIDKLSGCVLPVNGMKASADRKLAVPVENSMVRISHATIPELLGAVERGLDEEERERESDPDTRRASRRRRVLSARLAPDQLRSAGRRRLPLDVRAQVDQDTDRLTINVIGGILPEAHRVAASDELTRLAERRAKDEFFQALRGRVAVGPLEGPTLTGALARLQEHAVTASGIPPGQRRNWHLSLCEEARQLTGMLDDLVDREVSARLVPGTEQPNALISLIDSARAQIVLTAPWVSYDALAAVAPALRNALRRGVQVLLLWGIDFEQKLGNKVENLLYDMTLRSGNQAAGSGRVLVPRTSARTHAKVAIADDRRALVTSWNMVNSTRPGLEMGVEVADPGGGGCRTVRDLLRWARTVVPSYEMSLQVLLTPQDFVLRLPMDDTPLRELRAPQGPTLKFPHMPLEPSDGDDEAAAGAARAWSNSWVDYAGRLAEIAAGRVQPSAQLIIDAAHRDLLWWAVRTAKRRLIISTDRLSGQVADDRLLAGLAQALDRGCSVTVIYGRLGSGENLAAPVLPGEPPHSAAEQALHALQQQFPDGLRILRNGNHAKVLVWDDEVAVGSFNYLSHGGFNTLGASYRHRSEISARLSGRKAADATAKAVGAHDLGTDAQERSTANGEFASDPASLTAQHILNQIATGMGPVQTVNEHMGRDGDPWRTLERLADSASSEVMLIAAAACLSNPEGDAPAELRERWSQWLVRNLWADGRYAEAMLIRATVADEEFRPRLVLAILAGARGGGQAAAALDEALSMLDAPAGVLNPDGTALPDSAEVRHRWIAERTAVLCVALEQLLFAGSPDAAVAVQLACPPPDDEKTGLGYAWTHLAATALEYAAAADGQPLPSDVIRTDLDTRDDREALAEAWTRLDVALSRAENTSLQNTASLRTHLYLFAGSGGIFARLKKELADRRPASLRSWLREVPPQGVGKLIDVAAAVVAPGQEPMYGAYRKRYIKLLQSIVDEVRKVVDLSGAEQDGSGQDDDLADLVAAVRPLARAFATLWSDLVAASSAMPEPEGRFVDDLLSSFQALKDWGEHCAAPERTPAPGDYAAAVVFGEYRD